MRPGPNPPRQEGLLPLLEWDSDSDPAFVVIRSVDYPPPRCRIVAGFQITVDNTYEHAPYYRPVVKYSIRQSISQKKDDLNVTGLNLDLN